MSVIRCSTCEHGKWINPKTPCGKCVRFDKWEAAEKPMQIPKPIYLGHRKGN